MKIRHAHLRFLGQGFYVEMLVITAVDLVDGAGHFAELALLGDGGAQGATLFAGEDAVVELAQHRRAEDLRVGIVAHHFKKTQG